LSSTDLEESTLFVYYRLLYLLLGRCTER